MTAINLEIYGQGPALVMLHGWGMQSGVWREFARKLADHRQLICLDLPGHGGSDNLSPYTLRRVAEALLNAIPAQTFSLLGWSLGGIIALQMAELCPQRLQALILVAANPKFVQTGDWPGVQQDVLNQFSAALARDVQSTLQRFLVLQTQGSLQRKQVLAQLKSVMAANRQPQVEALRGGLDILKQTDLRSALSRLSCPTTYIYGAEDQLIPVSCAAAVQKLNPAINTRIIDNAGHTPFLSHGQQLHDLVLAAL